MRFLNFIAEDLNGFIWGWFGIVLLLGTGIIMTSLTKFFQISHFGHWMKKTIGSIFDRRISGHTKDSASISQFQALCTALAATVGTGNIAGVAGAIAVGGAGAVFWMWLSAFFGMMTNYSENILGIYFRRKDSKGQWAGGAMYYLQDGLGGRKNCKVIGRVLAILFSCFAVLASFGIGNLAQANTISGNMQAAFNIPRWVTGLVITAVAALVIIGGIKRIAAVAEKSFRLWQSSMSSARWLLFSCMSVPSVPFSAPSSNLHLRPGALPAAQSVLPSSRASSVVSSPMKPVWVLRLWYTPLPTSRSR